jgi:hypothetical protein
MANVTAGSPPVASALAPPMHQDFLVRSLHVSCRTPLAGSSLAERDAVELERLLRSIADRHRLRILNMLVRAGGAPICVREFTAAFDRRNRTSATTSSSSSRPA